jgi:hypothetical protein
VVTVIDQLGGVVIAWWWVIPFLLVGAAIGHTIGSMRTEREWWRGEEQRDRALFGPAPDDADEESW